MYFTLVLIFGTIALVQSQVIDYRTQLLTAGTRETFTCAAPGLVCSDCSTLSVCITDSITGKLAPIKVIDCDADTEVCYNKACVLKNSTIACSAPPGTFKCNAPGVFPNPFDCRVFHICKAADDSAPSQTKCENNYYYNPKTTYCDRVLGNGGICPNALPVPICAKVGNTGIVPANPSIYYICQTFTENNKPYVYPSLYLCPNGKIYDPINYQCK